MFVRRHPVSTGVNRDDFHAVLKAAPTASPIHRAELVLTVVVGLHLCFLPWALGTMHVWSQVLSLTFSVLSLVVALWPRRNRESRADRPAHLHPTRHLLRFPVFWIGSGLFAYIIIQALNPAWEYVPTKSGHWLRGIASIPWLPSGVRSPFSVASPWRTLMIYGSAWLSTCAIWVGFTRRTVLRALLVALVINGALLAVLGLLERGSHAELIFWRWHPPAAYFVSSFIYRNHAGAYFNLILAVGCALIFSYQFQRGRAAGRSGIVALLALLASLIAEIIVCSYSRGSIFLMTAFLLVVGGLAVRRIFVKKGARSGLAALGAGTGITALLAGSVFVLNAEQVVGRFQNLHRDLTNVGGNVRLQLDQATWQLCRDRLFAGWGAGSYRYVFPGYQVRFPEITVARDKNARLLFEHAHNDYLEQLSELGVIGCALLVAAAAYFVVALRRLQAWRYAIVWVTFPGIVTTAVHATFDFPFACPAILTTWCSLCAITARWAAIEKTHLAGANRPQGESLSGGQHPAQLKECDDRVAQN